MFRTEQTENFQLQGRESIANKENETHTTIQGNDPNETNVQSVQTLN